MGKKLNAKSNIIFLLYNFFVVVLILSAIEILFHYLYQNPAKIPKFAVSSFARYYSQIGRNTIQVEPDCAEFNPSLFYLLKPGLCHFNNVEFQTAVHVNTAGLRDSEDALISPNIIFIGDSFTMGWGVDQNSSFPKIAESEHAKTLNAGISSFGTVRELMLLKTLDIDSADKIVIQYHANDNEENLKFINHNFRLYTSSRTTYDSICKSYEKQRKYFPGKYISSIGRFLIKDITKTDEMKRDFNLEAKNFLQVLNNFPELNSKKLVIFEIGSRNVNDDSFINSLEKHLNTEFNQDQAKNFTLIRLKNVFTPEDYFILDDHLNTNGHKKLGELLKRVLNN